MGPWMQEEKEEKDGEGPPPPHEPGSLGSVPHPTPPPRTSCSRCTSLEGTVGGKWSSKACCFSCRREGANLWDGHRV